MRRLALLNFKGGVGKSTISVNLAHALALHDMSILLVDCDLQANSSGILPGDIAPPTLTQVLMRQAAITAAIRPTGRSGLDILPSDHQLDEAGNYINSQGQKGYGAFRAAMAALDKYDVVIYDLAPSYSPVAEAILMATDELLVPVELAPYSVEGLIYMLAKLDENLPKQPIIRGIVPSMLDNRYSMTGDYMADIKRTFGQRVTPPIRTDAAIPKAQAYHQTIFEYAPDCKAAEDFKALAAFVWVGMSSHAQAARTLSE